MNTCTAPPATSQATRSDSANTDVRGAASTRATWAAASTSPGRVASQSCGTTSSAVAAKAAGSPSGAGRNTVQVETSVWRSQRSRQVPPSTMHQRASGPGSPAPSLRHREAMCARSAVAPASPDSVAMRAASSGALAGVEGRACASASSWSRWGWKRQRGG